MVLHPLSDSSADFVYKRFQTILTLVLKIELEY